MAPKIKNLKTKPTTKRLCWICQKEKAMERGQRFCSPLCRTAASEIDKFGSEHHISIGKNK